MPPDKQDLPPLYIIHQTLGKHEARIDSLDGGMKEIKLSLGGIYDKINDVWKVLNTDQGETTAKDTIFTRLSGFMGWSINLLVTIIGLYIAYRMGKGS